MPIDPPTQTQSQLPDISDLLRPYARPAPIPVRAPPVPLPRSSVRAHTYDGKPLFIRRKQASSPYASRPASSSQMTNLLDVPLHRLLDELSVSAARKLAAEPETASTSQDADQGTSLWVDRYRPQRYTELLGDERVHRDVLAWVKEWDKCVFGRSSKAKVRNKKRAREGETQGAGFEVPEDEFGRPQEKMLLLWGPPGLGKTTLAHVVAKQAGYGVFEINASDARSGAVVDERIRPAVEAGSNVNSTKPTLVVIDEIDGATGGGDNGAGFVYKLIQLALEKPAKAKGRGKKDNQGKRPLLRPIICICNDLYAPALSKLRPIARIVKFSRPTDLLLVKRLRDICAAEALHADTRALGALVGFAQGDMRGCLNTLQMLKAKAGSRAVSEAQVRSAAAGLKEAEAGYVAVLNDLFAPLSKKRVMDLGMGEREQEKYVERLARALEGCGAMDRVALGAFEHYAKTHQHDATFARYAKAHRWLLAYDTLSGEMRTEREYALMPYLAYSLVPFYQLFQERGGVRVERPKADWEAWQKTKASEEIYANVAHAVRSGGSRRDGAYRDLVSGDILRLEFAPYLNRIISPPLRPVNSQVIRPEEKAILSRLVDIMASLELRFVQEKEDDGQLVYRLDPPVDIFVTYDGKRAADIGVSRYAVRHLVAAEIDAQLIARQADAVERTKSKPSTFFGKSKMHAHEEEDDRDDAPDDAEAGEGTLTNARPAKRTKVSASKEAAVDIADKPPVDFFGRPIVVKPKSKPSSKAQHGVTAIPMAERPYRVSYRFKEGNSAAVRKPVKLASFL
ncbi:P-loop containing nucleoside triphosphate hydrolase protein [Peniophora sp. CONT]|nr:P-loop containing nucleoside triphosphate hydrolase protein [Peniophora sp. CONT]